MVKRLYSMRQDGALMLNVEALLASDKVKRDLEIIREKTRESSAINAAWQQQRKPFESKVKRRQSLNG